MKVHHYSQFVHFSDVDMGGGMYHPRYLDYLDRARMSALKDKGVSFKELLHSGYALVVAEINTKYIKPAFFEDELNIYTRIVEVKEKYLKVEQIISKSRLESFDYAFEELKDITSKSIVTLVCVSLSDKKSCTFPKILENKLK